MIDYEKIRKNMVDCQLATGGVIAEDILEAFGTVPREQFVPAGLAPSAYVDEDLLFPDGNFLMEPLVFGRMLQAARPRNADTVLNVGDATGYAAAILSRLAGTVVNDTGGKFTEAPALVVINGAVAAVPDIYLNHLRDGGRLVCVLRESERRVGSIALVEKDGPGRFATRRLYDANVPYLPGFEPKRAFAF